MRRQQSSSSSREPKWKVKWLIMQRHRYLKEPEITFKFITCDVLFLVSIYLFFFFAFASVAWKWIQNGSTFIRGKQTQTLCICFCLFLLKHFKLIRYYKLCICNAGGNDFLLIFSSTKEVISKKWWRKNCEEQNAIKSGWANQFQKQNRVPRVFEAPTHFKPLAVTHTIANRPLCRKIIVTVANAF